MVITMMKQTNKNAKCMDLEYSDDYRAMMDFDNPYCYSFGRASKEHTHTDELSKLQNRMNSNYFDRR